MKIRRSKKKRQLTVIDANLHVVVTHAVNQQSFHVEGRAELCQLDQTVELDSLVDLGHLPHESDQSDVLQRLDVLLKLRIFLLNNGLGDSLNSGAEQKGMEVHLQPGVEVLQLGSGEIDNIHSNLYEKDSKLRYDFEGIHFFTPKPKFSIAVKP